MSYHKTITEQDLAEILNKTLPEGFGKTVVMETYTIPSQSYAANTAYWHYADAHKPTKAGYTFVGIVGYSQNSSGLVSNLDIMDGVIAGYTWNRTASAISQPIDVNCLFVSNATLPQELQDSGWITATLSSSFRAYTSGVPVEYRKIGDVVYIEGIVQPTSAIAGSDTGVTIFTLPVRFRPHKLLNYLCQGSASNKWLLAVNTNGDVTFARYGTTSYASASTSVWLPFSVSFAI